MNTNEWLVEMQINNRIKLNNAIIDNIVNLLKREMIEKERKTSHNVIL